MSKKLCFYKSSFCLNQSSLLTLYYSLVYSYLFYCAGVWRSTYHSKLRRITTLQKRVVRIISKSPYDAHTQPIFSRFKLLKFENIIELQLCKLLFLYQKDFLPESFNTMFATNKQVHSYNTRNKNSFRLPYYCRTHKLKNSLLVFKALSLQFFK